MYYYYYYYYYSTEQSPSWEANQFADSQEIPRIFMEPEGSLPYSQETSTCPYPDPTPSSPHNPLQLPEDPLGHRLVGTLINYCFFITWWFKILAP
jgi:hypothetical protein